MSRTTQARVDRSNQGFDSIHGVFRDFAALDETPCDLQDTPVHCQVVVPSSHDHVGPSNQTLFINFVVMYQQTLVASTTPIPSNSLFRAIDRT